MCLINAYISANIFETIKTMLCRFFQTLRIKWLHNVNFPHYIQCNVLSHWCKRVSRRISLELFSAETIDLTIISDNTKCDLQLIAPLQIIHWSLNAMSNTIIGGRS